MFDVERYKTRGKRDLGTRKRKRESATRLITEGSATIPRVIFYARFFAIARFTFALYGNKVTRCSRGRLRGRARTFSCPRAKSRRRRHVGDKTIARRENVEAQYRALRGVVVGYTFRSRRSSTIDRANYRRPGESAESATSDRRNFVPLERDFHLSRCVLAPRTSA